MGWRIYRIWSTDWIKDPVTEGEKLIAAINDAITNFGCAPECEPPDEPGDDEPAADDFVAVNKKEVSVAEQINPYGFAAFLSTDLSTLPRNSYGLLEVTNCIMACVTNEYPIHYELLCQKLAPLYGNEKATVRIRREVDNGIGRLGGKIVRRGDFIFPKGWEKITVRTPNIRKINHIATEELAEAMNTILNTTIGSTREGLCQETTRVYGWKRMTQNIDAAMNEACDLLIKQGRAQELDGKIVPKN